MSYGLKKQISKLDKKMGYFGGPNKALTNPCLKDQFGLKLGRIGWEKREKKRKKRRGRRRNQAKKVWKLTLFMNPMRLSMNFHALMVIRLPKSRVFARVSS